MQRRRDKFGTRIECSLCKNKGFEYEHHPFDCFRCYKCGIWGHIKRNCVSTVFRSARRLEFQDNSEMLFPGQEVSLDVENVQGNRKQYPGYVVVYFHPKTKKQIKSGVNIAYSAHITQIGPEIKSYATRWSGLSRIELSERSLNFREVKASLTRILSDRKVIGLGLHDDLKVLELTEVVPMDQRYDLKDHIFDVNRQPISLKALAFAFLGRKIQEYSPDFDPIRGHDPVIDARVTWEVYHHYTSPPFNEGNAALDWDSEVGALPNKCHQWVRNLISFAETNGDLPKLKR